MQRNALLLLGCLCVVLLSEEPAHTQRRNQPRQKSTVSKSASPRSGTQTTIKKTIAEKLVLEGICKTPSPFEWITASNINIPISSRSESTLVRLPDVLLRAQLLFHILSASDLKYLYETKSYKTEIFANTYKQHEPELKTLLAKVEDFKNERGSVSRSDRSALYPVIKAYFIDATTAIQAMPKSSIRGRFAEAYEQNEKAIADLANSKPEEGLNSYADKETPLVKVMTAYLIDFAILVRDSYQPTTVGNLATAYEKNKAKIGSLAAKDWKLEELSGDERDALRSVLVASSVDVANFLRGAYQTSNRGIFGEVYGKHAADFENLANKNWEEESSLEFKTSASALCQVLSAYRGAK